MIRMQVYKVGVDPQKRVPFVLLADSDIERLMPIYIGPFEANAIASQLLGQEFPRPLTHDLLRTLISETGYEVERIEITALREGVFYALMYLDGPAGRSLALDCRPSDALALALRTQAPIFVAESVLEEVQVLSEDLRQATEETAEVDRLRELLGDLPADADFPDPEDNL